VSVPIHSGGIARTSLNPRLPSSIPPGSEGPFHPDGKGPNKKKAPPGWPVFEPEGFAACSRWLRSEATTPPESEKRSEIEVGFRPFPGGIARTSLNPRLPSSIPPGSEKRVSVPIHSGVSLVPRSTPGYRLRSLRDRKTRFTRMEKVQSRKSSHLGGLSSNPKGSQRVAGG